jgi:hypothetical protein
MKMDTSYPDFSLYRFIDRKTGETVLGVVAVDTDEGWYSLETQDPQGNKILRRQRGYLLPMKDLDRIEAKDEVKQYDTTWGACLDRQVQVEVRVPDTLIIDEAVGQDRTNFTLLVSSELVAKEGQSQITILGPVQETTVTPIPKLDPEQQIQQILDYHYQSHGNFRFVVENLLHEMAEMREALEKYRYFRGSPGATVSQADSLLVSVQHLMEKILPKVKIKEGSNSGEDSNSPYRSG